MSMYGYDGPHFNPEPPDEENAAPEPISFTCASCHSEDRFMDRAEALGFGWTRTGVGLVCEECAAAAEAVWAES